MEKSTILQCLYISHIFSHDTFNSFVGVLLYVSSLGLIMYVIEIYVSIQEDETLKIRLVFDFWSQK